MAAKLFATGHRGGHSKVGALPDLAEALRRLPPMITGVEFIIVALGCFRLTRLAVLDTITEPLREATVYKLPDVGAASYVKVLFDCPWCIGFWISILAAVGWAIDSTVTLWIALPLAFSAVTGLLARNLDSEP